MRKMKWLEIPYLFFHNLLQDRKSNGLCLSNGQFLHPDVKSSLFFEAILLKFCMHPF
jgi:hypothetical protein